MKRWIVYLSLVLLLSPFPGHTTDYICRSTGSGEPVVCQPEQCSTANLLRLLRELLPHVGISLSVNTWLLPGSAISIPDTRSEAQRLEEEALGHEVRDKLYAHACDS